MTSDFLKKFLGPAQVEAALDEVSRLAGSRSNVALAGGVAMQLYGSNRLTTNVDVIAPDDIPGLERVKPLSFGGWQCRDSHGTVIDVIVRNDEYRDLYDDALLRAQPISCMDILVARPEHLVVMKMQAGRRKDEDDIVSVLKAGTVDLDLAKTLVRQYLGRASVKDLESYVKEAEWRRAEEEK